MVDNADARQAGRWGLVLSGGAACGLANVGVLEVLHEAGLRPACIAGSSMGAIVAAPYALGHPPSLLRKLLRGLAPATAVRLSEAPLRGGLHGGLLQQQLETHLGPLLGDARVGDCTLPFVCVAGRVRGPIRWHQILAPGFLAHLREHMEPHVFPPRTRLIDAVRASSALPVVFSPAKVDGREFVDLMQFGAIPVDSLRRACAPEVVVATDTVPSYAAIEAWLPSGLRDFIAEGRRAVERGVCAADLVIRPELPATMLHFDRGDDFADAGAQAARARLQELRTLLRRGATRRGETGC
jgi:NTE family protein